MIKIVKTSIVFGILLLVSACKEALYTDLDEWEVNQMVAVLEAAEVSVSRDRDADGNYSLLVDAKQIGASVLLLQDVGLPRRKYVSLGEVFPDTGIVGTPFEERARLMFALSQELSGTISAIDGVTESRVHIVLPVEGRFDREEKLASASVIIYYQDGFNAQTIVPTVKTLVEHGVPDLDYDGVSVSLFPVGGARLEVVPARTLVASAVASGNDAEQESTPNWKMVGTEFPSKQGSWIMVVVFLLVGTMLIAVWEMFPSIYKSFKIRRSGSHDV